VIQNPAREGQGINRRGSRSRTMYSGSKDKTYYYVKIRKVWTIKVSQE
jgi:hypothetical protein